MGSIFTPKVSAPPPPPPPPAPSSFRDEIGGTEQVPVKNADGTYTYVTKKIPLTAEQQLEQDEYKAIMKDALSEIKKLSAVDYESSEETKNILQAWENEKSKLLEDSFNERSVDEDKILARRGLSSSSAGEAVRRKRLNDKQEAKKQISREKELLRTDIRNDKLSLQQNLYNIAATRTDLENTKALKSATSGMSSVASINASNRASIADYYNRQLKSNNSRLQNTAPSLFGQVFNNTIGSNSIKGFLSPLF